MSFHIKTEKGRVAETVLMPGDPLRAKYIAENFLENPECYNEVRGMYGYTGTYKGKRISVQGSGMGIPSFSIYAHELINDYGAKRLIRVGSCGGMQENVKIRDIIIAMAATTDSGTIKNYFGNIAFAPTADYALLEKAVEVSKSSGVNYHVGNVFSADLFYNYKEGAIKPLFEYGVLAVEMEVAALYTIAAKHGVQGLGIMTVSDHLLTGEATSPEERETTFNDMIRIALDTAISFE